MSAYFYLVKTGLNCFSLARFFPNRLLILQIGEPYFLFFLPIILIYSLEKFYVVTLLESRIYTVLWILVLTNAC